jgi:hypothetical protein
LNLQVATPAGVSTQFISTSNVASGNCLSTFDAQAACTTGGMADDLVTVPASGGFVSNLYAKTNTAPTGGNSYTVSVLDNGTAIYSCTIASGTTTCTNTGAGVAVSAGDYLQVQITNNVAPNKQFVASFRF